jgi:hypothetical protein
MSGAGGPTISTSQCLWGPRLPVRSPTDPPTAASPVRRSGGWPPRAGVTFEQWLGQWAEDLTLLSGSRRWPRSPTRSSRHLAAPKPSPGAVADVTSGNAVRTKAGHWLVCSNSARRSTGRVASLRVTATGEPRWTGVYGYRRVHAELTLGHGDAQVRACAGLGVSAYAGLPSYLNGLLEAADALPASGAL